jgi:hypothetical protein
VDINGTVRAFNNSGQIVALEQQLAVTVHEAAVQCPTMIPNLGQSRA